jgi:aspartate aminotransferase
VSLARYYPEGTIISNGLSKWCGAGGWRLGFFVFPQTLSWLADAMAAVASETYTAISAPIQYAAVVALQDRPEMQDYLHRSQAILAALSAYASTRLVQADAGFNKASGGFYLFPSFEHQRAAFEARGIHDGMQLCERLLEDTGVAALPGRFFGRPEAELSMRIALVDFDGGPALAAAAQEPINPDFLRRYCGNVTTALDLLAGWVLGSTPDTLPAMEMP